MMKCCLFIFVCLQIIQPLFSKDKIVKNDGQVLQCQITAIDSSVIKFLYHTKDTSFDTFVEKKDIQHYEYKGEIVFIQTKQMSQMSPEFKLADSIENSNEFFLYTYTGEVIAGKTIEYKKPFLGTPRFEVDSIKIQPDIVRFYKDENGFYANTKSVVFLGSSVFIDRIRKGAINLYEEEATYVGYNSSGMMNSQRMNLGGTYMGGTYTGGFMPKSIKNYYNVGFGELKKANYKNLSKDLADNPESMLYLNKYKSISKTQTVLYLVGGGLIIAGFATLINKTKDSDGSDKQPEPNVTGNIVTVCFGAGCFWAAYFMSFSKPKQLRRAIDAYNR